MYVLDPNPYSYVTIRIGTGTVDILFIPTVRGFLGRLPRRFACIFFHCSVVDPDTLNLDLNYKNKLSPEEIFNQLGL